MHFIVIATAAAIIHLLDSLHVLCYLSFFDIFDTSLNKTHDSVPTTGKGTDVSGNELGNSILLHKMINFWGIRKRENGIFAI